MKLFILIILSALGAQASNYDDRFCGIDPANLWLDIVLVVDNSILMSKHLSLISSTISDLFCNGTRIGTNYNDPRSTRVSLITYNERATVVADLNKYQSFSDLSNGLSNILTTRSDMPDAYLSLGLSKADEVLTAGRSNYRTNYKQMIIVFAGHYQLTTGLGPIAIADILMRKDVKIAVVDFSKGDSYFKFIASLGMYTTPTSDLSNFLVRQTFQVNCFCQQGWKKYQPYDGYFSGLCLQVSDSLMNWSQAKLTCQNMAHNGYLATEFSRNKHWLIQSLLQNTTDASSYHIGLNVLNGVWYWTQPAGQAPVPLYQGNQEVLWNAGYPISAAIQTAGANFIDSNGKAGWQNINSMNEIKPFVCERYTCDTDNYCA